MFSSGWKLLAPIVYSTKKYSRLRSHVGVITRAHFSQPKELLAQSGKLLAPIFHRTKNYSRVRSHVVDIIRAQCSQKNLFAPSGTCLVLDRTVLACMTVYEPAACTGISSGFRSPELTWLLASIAAGFCSLEEHL